MSTLTADAALADATGRHSLSCPGSSVEDIASKLVGLHNTSPVSPYLSLGARLPGFARSDLDELMWGSWRLARFRAMRMTMFNLPGDLIEIAAAATRHLAEPLAARWLRDSNLSQRRFDELAAGVHKALAEGPLTVRALRDVLDLPVSIDLSGIVGRMCDAGQLVGGAPPRSWRSSVREYHRWEDVLADVELDRWGEEAAIRELIFRYISAYGPVTVADISWWTGFTKARSQAALAALHDRVEEVAVEAWPGPLFRLRGSDPAHEQEGSVRALPLLDPYVQGYRDRIRFLEPELHDFVYDGGGNSAATLVYRGRIIGVWQATDDPTESVRYHLFGAVTAGLRQAAESELAAAGALYFDHPVDVVEVATMRPLRADGGRSASHPLDSRLHRASRRQRTASE